MGQDKSKTFEDVTVWQKAHQFVLDVYNKTKVFPKEELFGLTSQFKRAAISIPANIAEGYGKKGTNDKLQFYNIAEGSINEYRYYTLLSKDLGYISNIDSNQLYDDLIIQKLLFAYSQSLKSNKSTNYKLPTTKKE